MTSDLTSGTPKAPTVAAVQRPDSSAVTELVSRLRATFAAAKTKDVQWRIRQLHGVERLLEEHEKAIADALYADLGRPYGEAWLGDIASSKAEAAFARKRVRRWVKRRRTSVALTSLPGRGWYEYEPLGTVLIIGPWNYPVYLTLGPLVAAIAAGNCAVIKPSEHAPATARLLADLLPKYVDRQAYSVVQGEAELTKALIGEGFDHVFFTGGTEVGRRIMEAAAPNLTPVTLELGGKSPVIITESANLAVAAKRIAWVKLLNSGQTCIAPDYVLVQHSVQDRFLEELTKAVRALRAHQSCSTQPIVNRRQFERLTAALDGSDGERVVGGGYDAAALGIEPTIILDPAPDSPVMAEEIFGPILPVLTVDSLDSSVRFVNERPKPLAIYLFTKSNAQRERVLQATSSGGVVVNHVAMHCLEPNLPFGGVGDSGIGAYHGRWGFENLSHRKAVLSKPSRPDPALLYPPYTERKLRLLRRFF
ncbi:aldehyde dehydrogenase family protein [Sciscionella sediminilitoris]|uniref:aldehyde dehydrogenase family protein n=1 Tax=Sciscionella sediminilitoris TaxID=1445613 RepID=UPI0009E9DA11|nr:aldehyde dehydrogenase family protein [Sciscionella sp. SE31]